MRILLIGPTGTIGSALRRHRDPADTWLEASRATLELTDEARIEACLDEQRPDVVINTAALLGVDPCALQPELACSTNTLGPWRLARACQRRDIGLVHFSTDAVFPGKADGLYTEDDVPAPLNLYGLSKHGGDLAIQANCAKHWIMRIPIIFGTRENAGSGFVDKMVQLARDGRPLLRISDDVISSPSYSDDVAREVLRLIAEGVEPGTYHVRNEGEASLYDLATATFERLGIEIEVQRAKAAEFAPNEKDIKALRTPLGSVKIGPLRPWEEALDDYVAVFRTREGM